LGNGTTTTRRIPVPVSGLGGVGDVSAGGGFGKGGSHSLALKDDGTVWAWGYNGDGQLGDGTTIRRTTPVQMTGLDGVVSELSGGGGHSLVLKDDGTMETRGTNGFGQLGVGSLAGVVDVEAGFHHSLALKGDGTVRGSGENDDGELGNGTTTDRTTPVRVFGLSGVMDVSGGYEHGLAISTMVPIYCKRSQVVCRGTAATDYIVGTAYPDTIKAGSGEDQIYAYCADDIIYGGDDRDVIDGSEGKDRLYGGDGPDTINTGVVGNGPDGDGDYVNCGAQWDTVYREKDIDRVVDCEVIRNR